MDIRVDDRQRGGAITLSIAAVERDTGLSKDTLRVWERRYGFPAPGRDAVGERSYPLDQVEKLRLIKRLMDAGHRPGRVVPLSTPQLQVLAEQVPQPTPRAPQDALSQEAVDRHFALLRNHDLAGLRAALARLQARVGLARFVTEVVAPLNVAVGEAWMRGQIEIFEEHASTEVTQNLLRHALCSLPTPSTAGRPAVLLTTLPGEGHGLGLLMAEALLTLEGCSCVNLGVQTPPWDIVGAASAYRADVVALSFTACMHPTQVVEGLTELRSKLPASVDLWAGGSAPVLHRRRVPGVLPLATLESLPAALQDWRARYPC